MFSCVLCEKETVYVSNFCETCSNIKKICLIVGSNETLDILTNICIRDKQKRENKVKLEKGESIEKIKTRSQTKNIDL